MFLKIRIKINPDTKMKVSMMISKTILSTYRKTQVESVLKNQIQWNRKDWVQRQNRYREVRAGHCLHNARVTSHATKPHLTTPMNTPQSTNYLKLRNTRMNSITSMKTIMITMKLYKKMTMKTKIMSIEIPWIKMILIKMTLILVSRIKTIILVWRILNYSMKTGLTSTLIKTMIGMT